MATCILLTLPWVKLKLPNGCLKTPCFITSCLLHHLPPWKCDLQWDFRQTLQCSFVSHDTMLLMHDTMLLIIFTNKSRPTISPSFSGNLLQSNNCACLSGPSTRCIYTDCSVGQFHFFDSSAGRAWFIQCIKLLYTSGTLAREGGKRTERHNRRRHAKMEWNGGLTGKSPFAKRHWGYPNFQDPWNPEWLNFPSSQTESRTFIHKYMPPKCCHYGQTYFSSLTGPLLLLQTK